MDDWRRSVNDYQTGINSIAQSNLNAQEQITGGRAQLLSSKEALLESTTGTQFSNKLKEESSKFIEEQGIDLSARGILPGALQGLSKLASWRSNALNSAWKTTQSTRFAEQEEGGGLPEPKVPSGEDTPVQFDDDPFQPTAGQSLRSERGTGPISQEPDAGVRQPTQLSKAPITEEDTGVDLSTDISKVSQQAEDASSGLTTSVGEEAGEIGEEAGGVVEDLAPELTSAASGWSTAASALGTAAGVAGTALSAFGIGAGIYGLVETIKDEDSDPYAKIRGQLAQAQTKITGFENDVSADEFASKIGARQPQFGSLAARPNMDTAMGGGIALHI